MKLSELSSGEKGIIVKVMGHGGFRKRIIEMGFVKGKTVEVLLNAPLQDPVKYKVMGYEVSLRRQEAEQIEVINDQQARDSNTGILDKDTVYEDLREAHHEALRGGGSGSAAPGRHVRGDAAAARPHQRAAPGAG